MTGSHSSESLGSLAALFAGAPDTVHEQAQAYLFEGEREVFPGIVVMAGLMRFEPQEPALALTSR